MQGTIPIPSAAGGHLESSRVHAILDGLVQSQAVVNSEQPVTRAQLAEIKSEMQGALAALNSMMDEIQQGIERRNKFQHTFADQSHLTQKLQQPNLNQPLIQPIPVDLSSRGSQQPGQKTGNKPRDERHHKRNSNVHSERSVRSNDRKILTEAATSGNPLDIWFMSAPLFKPVPTEEELNEICRMVLMDKPVEAPRVKTHWSERMRQIVIESQRGTNKKLQFPPGPPPAADDVAEYWKKRAAPFPIEDIQRHNNSVMHCLLNAFVDAKPLPKSSDGDSRDFLPTHVLLPRIEFDEYLSRSFEERLELELKSAGLEKPASDTGGGDSGLFAQEIEQFKEELDKLRPEIERMRMEIVARLPEMREMEERRAEQLRKYEEIKRQIKPETKRSHKK